MSHIWLFGYGSLIWRPDFDFRERATARLEGYERRFWQGSHDHRGVPAAPGRVVTLVPRANGHCDGVAFLIDADFAEQTFAGLDHREKNGYARHEVELGLADGRRVRGRVYLADERNVAFLGEASLDEMARQVLASHGPSGSNREYLLELAAALRALDADDPHVFALESRVLTLAPDSCG